MSTYPLGVIHGRFQVPHNDHLRYLLAGKELCDHLVVGITNPDPSLTRHSDADPARSSGTANPLSYYERCVLMRRMLVDAGVSHNALTVVPLPINLPELYRHYVPLNAVFFLTIYDGWGRQKLEFLQSLQLRTHILWEVSPEEKGISATDVRARMARGEPWQHLVPQSVAPLLEQWDIPGRLKALSQG